jgi:hypothetical protein
MTELTLSERLMPVGHEALYSIREMIDAGFATIAEKFFGEVKVAADIPESELWPLVKSHVDREPAVKTLLKEKHSLLHVWLYGL